MKKLFSCILIFSSVILFSTVAMAQDSQQGHVFHVQTLKFKSMPTGDDAAAFSDMLKRQTQAVSGDKRLVSFKAMRHNWGHDSRDLVLISEFKSRDDLFSFYDDFGSMMEKAFSEDQLEKDNELWNKYVGEHSDEIYSEISGTRK